MQELRVNRQIRAKEVRLIDEKGQNLGVVPVEEALRIAEEKNLDLVEVSPNANPPVCKIMDYGKYKFEQKKKEKEAKKKQKAKMQNVKEIKFRIKIEDHDYQTKVRHIREFIEEGDKVKVWIWFRGRENVHPELGEKLAQRIIEDLSDIAKVEKPPKKEGRNMLFTLVPKGQK
ncbi:bacterial translation initiation factor 3 (bIF-3) [Persephonella hydrogeniphila]|uniref:Translation initiation factor IF-3 n=1 Tax=Persephonella hydrogeniphila TaxID=198703 RepID=A0A285NC40_9AQUI|nr:translation initiation factor IF-3 [Persephonella hydrogeniphila]SNZ07074.1 bacterial translation initiation factor 3 (bIF-3) [Persephonella hydrogeniphila]